MTATAYPPASTLATALQSLVSETPLPVRLSARGVTSQSPEVEAAVYFVCAEAVANAVKHAAGASGLWIMLRQTDTLRFEIRDDGAGFEPPLGGFDGGRRSMRDRIEAIGGRLTIDSSPGRGTRIRGTVPLA